MVALGGWAPPDVIQDLIMIEGVHVVIRVRVQIRSERALHPLESNTRHVRFLEVFRALVQFYRIQELLAHEKAPPPRTVQ